MKKMAKKLIVLVLAAVLLLQALPMAGAADNTERENPERSGAFIVVKTVYLLDSNGSNPNIILTLYPGTKVYGIISSWNENGNDPFPVTYGSYSGYVSESHICPKNNCFKVTKTGGTTLWVNYTCSGSTVGSLSYGDYLYRISTCSGSYYVRAMSGTLDGNYGYVDTSSVNPC